MLVKFDDKKLQKIIKHYGEKNQIEKCCEEMKKLTFELNKNVIDSELVIDEIADVIITTLQMALIFGFERVMNRVQYKISRTITRIWINQMRKLWRDVKNV